MAVTVTKISGIGPKTAAILANHGFKTVEAIAKSTVEKLSGVPGFGPSRSRTIISAASALVAGTPAKTSKTVSSPKTKAGSKKIARAGTKSKAGASKKVARDKTKPKKGKKAAGKKSSGKEKLRKEKLKKEKLRKEKLKKEKLRKEKLKKEKLR